MSLIKECIKYIDKKFFHSSLVEFWGFHLFKQQRSEFDSNFDRSMRINYFTNKNLLAEYCDNYGTDKGSNIEYDSSAAWPSHTYTDFYYDLFFRSRFDVKNVFECGIGTNNSDVKGHFKLEGNPGASLRVWRDFFPNAQIYGVDIDSRSLIQENRITTKVMDQTDPNSISNFFKQLGSSDFDIMIDDGLHEYYAGKILLENAFKYLKVGGIYIIEDVVLEDLESYANLLKDTDNYVRFASLQRDKTGLKSIAHNSLVVIEKRVQTL